MKKILITIILLMTVMGLQSQCNQPYRAFSTFANDTTAFLQYNFKTRADCYKGKTVAQVLADLQLTPRSYTPAPSIYTGKYAGVRIHVDNTTTNERLQNSKLKTQYIYIYWKELLDYGSLLKLGRKYESDIWLQEHYDLLKNNIVGEVSTK